MFGIGTGELLVLLALTLIIVGPQKLPEMARTMGRAISQFKAYTDDMRSVLVLESSAQPEHRSNGVGGPAPTVPATASTNMNPIPAVPRSTPTPTDAYNPFELINADTNKSHTSYPANEPEQGHQ